MVAGRKVIPIVIKKAKGTHEKHRDKKTPKFSKDIAQAPSYLNKRATEIFNHLVEKRLKDLGLASASHTEIIANLAKRMERLEVIDAFIDKYGVSYETQTEKGETIFRPRPEAAMQKELARHVHALLCEFGLTPASAGKVTGFKDEEKDPTDDLFD